VIAVDTSVVVAAFASWHEGHRTAAAALARKPRVPTHVLVETFSVLTRLPPPHRAPPDLVATFLAERFTQVPLTLPPRAHLRLIE
jgi:predicted nucleic acid-binding protein